ncbi:uncharacterized protein HMPREF1541_04885 [Cyphellophora europaea CBS 101466]|uniref:Uncharacterized protein n=1 Tax=Cyphellophora europaea (strain CBS 101466) TaxID=1220924 RepID=W2RXV3_CYPE1|nr:uncharacterized protein HMPREF1541_04885 [Cyphellophora europaea CBS 101466]ETN40608.1 hypothetical protein HMPREF1541_04885 [Cyphellophora europaea CBS 101466]
MPSPLVNATLQAAVLSALSNLLAQGIKAYQKDEPLSLNLVALGQFVFFTLLTCPPNFLWQQYLEETFPGYVTGLDGSQSLHKINTAKKFALDQTIGAVVNTVAFVAFFAALSGKDSNAIQRTVRRETLPLMMAGWKLWPAVSFLNFTVVPMHRRILVGSIVGLFWGIYLSLFAVS